MNDSQIADTEQARPASDDYRKMAAIQRRLAVQMPNAAYRERLLQSAVRFDALADAAAECELSTS